MGGIDYRRLYKLQDEVLEVVFETERVFYLTGGTCLNRFYHEKRYSDDLDFFTHDDRDFLRATKTIKSALRQKFEVTEEINVKDFIRLLIDGRLQVDFVNDRTPRYGQPVMTDKGYLIDTVENILSNKLTAVMGRDNPKDMFDIFLINKFYDFDFCAILESAHEKAGFSDDDLITRLKGFPVSWIEKISIIDEGFLDGFEAGIVSVIAQIEHCQNQKA